MGEPTRVLILGGTAEASGLARALAGDARVAAITSLAGRTRAPAAVPGEVRVGGFGGPEALAEYLRQEGPRRRDVMIDPEEEFEAAHLGGTHEVRHCLFGDFAVGDDH